jgi:hypothetical protein
MNVQTHRRVDFTEIALFAITRALAGAGLGLLIADRIEPVKRKTVAWTLLGVGAVTAIPFLLEVFVNAPRFAAVNQEQVPPVG